MAVGERYGEGRMRLMPVGLLDLDDDDRPLVYPVDKGSGATTSLVEADGIVEVHPDTEYLAADEGVEVQLFSPEVRAPSVFGVGEDDPAFSRLLDSLRSPRYLSLGTREGLRRFRNGVPDVAVAAGIDPDEIESAHEPLGGWTREWGLLVPEGNPEDVTDLADLVDRDLRFVNRGTNSGLRTALDDAITALADDRDASRRDLTDAIDGYELTVKAHESPARKVAAGTADAGLGLRATAAKLGLEYVPLGEQPVVVVANPERVEKAGVQRLRDALADVESVVADLDGYGP